MKKKVGLHLRIQQQIEEIIKQAQELDLPVLQCFLMNQKERRPLTLNANQIAYIRKQIDGKRSLYIHGSYLINPANLKKNGKKTLFKELDLAQKLGAAGIILHAGSATGEQTHAEGITSLAHVINEINEAYPDVTVILENSAHSKKSVGSDWYDFKKLKEMLTHPNAVKFCIDTAHAHAFGYDLQTAQAQATFLSLVDECVGLENVVLIHLNDPAYHKGSFLDRHEIIGKGKLGTQSLRSFLQQPQIASLPVILELPVVSQEEEHAMLKAVASWHV